AGKVDRIHETGILGSLRWWFEVLVRGLGGKACDLSKGSCGFDEAKYRKSGAEDERQRLRDAGLCDVCQVFGATGWRRRFQVRVVDETQPDESVQSTIQVKKDSHTSTWYFPQNLDDKPRSGNFTLHIQSLDRAFSPDIIAGLIQFIADWAALGARAQMGFGVVEPVNGRLDTQQLCNYIVSVAGQQTYPDLPSLQNIFLARIKSRNGKQFSATDTFTLKYDLRRLFANNQPLRHFIMGTVKDQRIAAKVKMSRPYNDGKEMRVWGWIPEQASVYQGSLNRNAVVQAIHQHLQANYGIQVWREMNSSRDTVTPDNGNAEEFLKSLLCLKGEENAV
ncbi:MAG: type III-B CRISPR module RAMP protein Cmr1, partial [Anaerolineales bacterium]|nr:type III-B CRISPR module RAMP protein Cmr1 [Anaerolineales bacterium]